MFGGHVEQLDPRGQSVKGNRAHDFFKYHFFRGVYIARATCISMDSSAV